MCFVVCTLHTIVRPRDQISQMQISCYLGSVPPSIHYFVRVCVIILAISKKLQEMFMYLQTVHRKLFSFLFMLRRSYEASRTRSVGLSVGWLVGRSSKQSLVHSKKNKLHE